MAPTEKTPFNQCVNIPALAVYRLIPPPTPGGASRHLLTDTHASCVPLCAGPLYGSLLKAWKCFLSSADRLASYHASMCRSLVAEDGDRVRSWQKESFHKKFFGGFKESQDFGTGFARAQKPWAKRLKKVGREAE